MTCTTPCSLALAAGRHTLNAIAPGTGTAKRIFNVPESSDIFVDLQRSEGVLLVSSEPPGALVMVDGREMGTTPARLRLASGQHRLAVVNGKNRAEDTVSISAEQLTSRTYRW